MRQRSARLGRQLVDSGRILPEALRKAEAHRQVQGGELDTALLELGILDEDAVLEGLGRALAAPVARAEDLETIAPEVLKLVPAKVALRRRAIAFRAAGPAASVAVLDPGDLALLDELTFVVGRRVKLHAATEVHLERALGAHFGQPIAGRLRDLAERLAARRRLSPPGAADEEEPEFDLLAEPASPAPPGRRDIAPERAPPPPEETVSASEPPPVPPGPAKASEPGSPARPRVIRPEPPQRPLVVPLSETERHRLNAPAPRAEPPREPAPSRVAAAGRTGDRAATREAIAERLLDQAKEGADRVVLLRLRGQHAEGWGARGRIDTGKLSTLRLDLAAPSFLSSLRQGARFYLGPLPPLAANLDLAATWGGALPSSCLAVPIPVRGKLAAVLYLDRSGRAFSAEDLERAHLLATTAAAALGELVLRGKSKQS